MNAFYSTGPLPEPHADCGPQWECWLCGRSVCTRCEPSPAEFAHCAECHDFIGGAA